MYRVADATDKLMDGNTAAAWTQSTPPSLNFDPNKIGVRIGSPGRDRLLTAADEAAAIAADAAKVTADAAAAAKAADTSSFGAEGRSSLHQRSYVLWWWNTAAVD